MVEFTIPFETGIEDAAQQKQAKYAELVDRCRRIGFTTTLTLANPLAAGSRWSPSASVYKEIIDQ